MKKKMNALMMNRAEQVIENLRKDGKRAWLAQMSNRHVYLEDDGRPDPQARKPFLAACWIEGGRQQFLGVKYAHMAGY